MPDGPLISSASPGSRRKSRSREVVAVGVRTPTSSTSSASPEDAIVATRVNVRAAVFSSTKPSSRMIAAR